MDIRSLAFRTDLALHRLAGAEVRDRGDHVVVRTPDNPGYRWGNFHLLTRPPAVDEVGRVITRYDDDFPGCAHRTFGVDGIDDQRARLEPLQARGLSLEGSTVMTASSVHPPPRPNSEATYRRLTSDDDWAQKVEVSIAVDDGEDDPVAHREYAVRRAAAERGLCERGRAAWWGAFVDGRLAGSMGLVDAGDGLARFQNVETHPDHRGRGLAGTLVHRVASFGFENLGARILVMVADPDYLAIRIYRSVGFVDTETQTQLEQRDRASAQSG